MNMTSTAEQFHKSLLISFFAFLLWSVINPRNYLVWFAEVLPVIIGLLLILLTYNRFRLTNLTYVLTWVVAVIILIGGHYTYSEMPLFEWIKNHFDLARNHYDRFGHFFQGVLPAILVREILLRKTPLRREFYVSLIALSTSLALSAGYELLEWMAAEIAGSGARDFLATQGDKWDTQWDMFMALCGAILSLLTLRRIHDRQLESKSDD